MGSELFLTLGDSRVLERYRYYLYLIARVQLDGRLQGKVDLSGVIQQTLVEAYAKLPRFEAKSEAEMAAWLRRILANNLMDEIRKLRTGKRDIDRERSLEQALEQSSAKLENWLAADQSTPSQKVERQEQALQVAAALAGLPESQREALELQHWHGWKLAEIAAHMGKSRASVAGLIKRGLEQLRRTMNHEQP
jgi:RNA polymerase sigma-70 factor (ECF subfamily)